MTATDCNISKAAVNPYYGREIHGCEALGLDPGPSLCAPIAMPRHWPLRLRASRIRRS
jgi:hypothetical protein